MLTDRAVAGLLLAPIAAAIGLSYGRIAASLDDTPADADYVAARTILERDGYVRGTDALAILPAWSLRPLVVMGDLDPISADHLERQPLHRYRRLFVIVEPTSDSAHDALVDAIGRPAATTEAGRVRVERFDLPAPTLTYDLRQHIADARVRIVNPSGADTACTTPIADRGFACAGEPQWQRVERAWLLVSENADNAVWSHPPPAGERLEIAWDNVKVGSAIVVRAGHLREGADQARAPVRVHVLIDGVEVGVVERRPVFDFRTDVVSTASQRGTVARVTLAIETDDNASNHFAWDAYVIDGANTANTANTANGGAHE